MKAVIRNIISTIFLLQYVNIVSKHSVNYMSLTKEYRNNLKEYWINIYITEILNIMLQQNKFLNP